MKTSTWYCAFLPLKLFVTSLFHTSNEARSQCHAFKTVMLRGSLALAQVLQCAEILPKCWPKQSRRHCHCRHCHWSEVSLRKAVCLGFVCGACRFTPRPMTCEVSSEASAWRQGLVLSNFSETLGDPRAKHLRIFKMSLKQWERRTAGNHGNGERWWKMDKIGKTWKIWRDDDRWVARNGCDTVTRVAYIFKWDIVISLEFPMSSF